MDKMPETLRMTKDDDEAKDFHSTALSKVVEMLEGSTGFYLVSFNEDGSFNNVISCNELQLLEVLAHTQRKVLEVFAATQEMDNNEGKVRH